VVLLAQCVGCGDVEAACINMPIIVRARVKGQKNLVRHGEAEIEGEQVVLTEAFLSASTLEIEDTDDGFLLLRYDKDGAFAGDTWHLTVEEAKEQAAFEFELDKDGWVPSQP